MVKIRGRVRVKGSFKANLRQGENALYPRQVYLPLIGIGLGIGIRMRMRIRIRIGIGIGIG